MIDISLALPVSQFEAHDEKNHQEFGAHLNKVCVPINMDHDGDLHNFQTVVASLSTLAKQFSSLLEELVELHEKDMSAQSSTPGLEAWVGPQSCSSFQPETPSDGDPLPTPAPPTKNWLTIALPTKLSALPPTLDTSETFAMVQTPSESAQRHISWHVSPTDPDDCTGDTNADLSSVELVDAEEPSFNGLDSITSAMLTKQSTSSLDVLESQHRCSDLPDSRKTALRGGTFEMVASNAVSSYGIARRVSDALARTSRRQHVLRRASKKQFFTEKRRPSSFVMHPSSNWRLAWDAVAMLLLSFDVVWVPLQVFDMRLYTIQTVSKFINVCFWSIDMIAAISTGVYIRGVLSMDRRAILIHYFRTWLFFDVMLLTFDWMSIFFDVSEGSGAPTFLVRFGRGARFARLVRLCKLDFIFSKYLHRSHASLRLRLLLRTVGYILCMLILMHVITCFWYEVGGFYDHGWIHKYSPSSSTWHQYCIAFHWSLSNFHGTSELVPQSLYERMFAISISFTGLVVVTMFQSKMTESMLQLQAVKRQLVEQNNALMTFFRQRQVNSVMTLAVRNRIEDREHNTIKLMQDLTCLEALPSGLLMDLQAEVRVPVLLGNYFLASLRDIFPKVIRQICHNCMGEKLFRDGDLVFLVGDTCSQMMFIDKGSAEYVTNSTVLSSSRILLSISSFACEAVLWMKWTNRGSLHAVTDLLIQTLEAKSFLKLLAAESDIRSHVQVYVDQFIRYASENVIDDLFNACDVGLSWANTDPFSG